MRLTRRLLEAMSAATGAMGAGMQGEGDWPGDVSRRDMDDAETWIEEQLARRKRPTTQTERTETP